MCDTILLIEDSQLDADLTILALGQCGITNPVVHVPDAEPAIALLGATASEPGARDFGLILLDVRMPKIDGFEVLKFIRSVPHLQDVPAVVMTEVPVEADRMRASLLGAANYMAKAMGVSEYSQLLRITLTPFI